MVADHLSRLEDLKPDHVSINDDFTYEKPVSSVDIKGISYDHYHEYLKAQYSNVKNVIEEEVVSVHMIVPWYADYINYLTTKVLHPDMT